MAIVNVKSKAIRKAAIGLGALAIMVGSAASATVVASASFETPVFPGQSIQYGADQFGYNTNATGAVSVSGFTFTGFSGLISNGTKGIFTPTTDGNQAAFVQAYNGVGSEIDWQISGLTVGQQYELTFLTAGSLVVPTATFYVSGLGITPTAFTPGTALTKEAIDFTASAASGALTFVVNPAAGNAATEIDALSISSVPEPATWALMLAGFGMIGLAMRKRSRVGKAATFA